MLMHASSPPLPPPFTKGLDPPLNVPVVGGAMPPPSPSYASAVCPKLVRVSHSPHLASHLYPRSAATQRHRGDIAYFPLAEELAEGSPERRKRGATSRDNLLWPNGVVYYLFSSQFTGETSRCVHDLNKLDSLSL